MTTTTREDADALALSTQDNVATALRAIAAGERIFVRCQGLRSEITAIDAIPFGHKLCLRALTANDTVRKYGEAIGHTVEPIAVGRHVHIHNMRSDRAQQGRRTC